MTAVIENAPPQTSATSSAEDYLASIDQWGSAAAEATRTSFDDPSLDILHALGVINMRAQVAGGESDYVAKCRQALAQVSASLEAKETVSLTSTQYSGIAEQVTAPAEKAWTPRASLATRVGRVVTSLFRKGREGLDRLLEEQTPSNARKGRYEARHAAGRWASGRAGSVAIAGFGADFGIGSSHPLV